MPQKDNPTPKPTTSNDVEKKEALQGEVILPTEPKRAKTKEEKRAETLARTAPYRWKKGQSGNPKGKPCGKEPISVLVRQYIQYAVPGTSGKVFGIKKTLTLGELAVLGLFRAASKGDIKAIELIWDRMEGKIPARQELSGPNGTAIEFQTPASREEAERRIAILMQIAADTKAKEE